jgi:3-oxoacyl-[acyl-carrier protein] reductase
MSDTPAYVIVGATGGIGFELCHRLAARGPCRLMLAARDGARLGQLAAELQVDHPKAAPDVMCLALDATRSGEVEEAFGQAGTEFGRLDGVVNLCGSILLKPAHMTSDQEFADTLAINLTTAFNVLRAAVKPMSEHGGAVVLMSSVAASIGLANHEAIAAAKAGVNGLVISAAATYAPRNIRVNAVAPGLVRTPLSSKITANELALKASTAMQPLGRVGEPGDVAAVVAWLLDPATTWVTGQVIGVDGGLSTVRAK